MPSKPTQTLLLLCLASCLAGCSGFVRSYAEAGKLQQQLKDKYLEKDVNVSLRNSRYLTISFIDSPLNQRDAAKRAARAEEVAKFVIKNIPSIGEIYRIEILFLESDKRWIVFRSWHSLGYFAFNNRGEPFRPYDPPPPVVAADNEDPLAPNVKYNQARNETDISLTRIQLSGDLTHGGMALVPYFTVKGDARGPVRSV